MYIPCKIVLYNEEDKNLKQNPYTFVTGFIDITPAEIDGYYTETINGKKCTTIMKTNGLQWTLVMPIESLTDIINEMISNAEGDADDEEII